MGPLSLWPAFDLNVGTALQEKDLRLVKLPPGDLPAGVFHRTSEVVGRGVLIPMSKNEPVLSSKIAAENGGAGLPSMIQTGMRAVSVKVNDVVSVAGFVVPGTRVDVLLTGIPARESELTTTTVLEKRTSAGSRTETSARREWRAATGAGDHLLVSPEDAQKLTLANSDGKIQLSLRNPLDNVEEQPESVKNTALYRLRPAPVPVSMWPKNPITATNQRLHGGNDPRHKRDEVKF